MIYLPVSLLMEEYQVRVCLIIMFLLYYIVRPQLEVNEYHYFLPFPSSSPLPLSLSLSLSFPIDSSSYIAPDFQRANSFSTFNPSEENKQIEYFFASDAR